MGFDEFFAISPVNLAGWAGLALIAVSFQFKERIVVGLLIATATVAMTTHYVGKEAWAAVAVAGTMIVGHVCGAFAGRHLWLRHAKIVLLPVLWGLSVMTYRTWLDVLPALGVTVEVFCLTQRHTVIMRSGFLVSQPIWALYNFAVLSGPGLLANLLVFSSSLIGLARHHPPVLLRRRHQTETPSR